MRFWSANGVPFTLELRDHSTRFTSPGLFYVVHGRWTVDGVLFTRGKGGELFRRASNVIGYGLIAHAGCTMDHPHESDMPVERRDVVRHDKPWGYELEVMSVSRVLQLKYLHIEDGAATSLHYHNEKIETMMFIDGGPDSHIHCPAKTPHRIYGPADYVEASTYHPNDVVRIEDSYGRA